MEEDIEAVTRVLDGKSWGENCREYSKYYIYLIKKIKICKEFYTLQYNAFIEKHISNLSTKSIHAFIAYIFV